MTSRRVLKEWPLVAFTLATQCACACALAVTLAIGQTPSGQFAIQRSLALSVFPLLAVGLLCSVLHLGRPSSAWRALNNPFGSALGLEILLTLAFAASAFGLALATWTRPGEPSASLAALTSLLGAAAVLASAAVYMVTARPSWRSASVPLSFAGGTAVIAGVLTRAFVSGNSPGILLTFGSGMLLLAAVMMLRGIGTGSSAPALRPWMVLYLILALSPCLLLVLGGEWGFAILSLMALAAVLLGRLLMFAAAELEPGF